jgi:hypothetical protein
MNTPKYANIMDEWGGWHREHEEDGVIKQANIKSVSTIRSYYTASRYLQDSTNVKLDEKAIKEKLTFELAIKLIQDGLVSYHKYFDNQRQHDTIEAEVIVCPPGTKFANVVDECFKVNGELFSEEEIIHAIKNTYPDRLI